jgi:hypothetical protein
MRRTFIAVGIAGALALAACGAPAANTDLAAVAVALEQVGFATELGEPSANPSSPAAELPRRPIRKYLRGNTLHGEIVVQTKDDGPRTVVVQRGSVTEVSADAVTVKSTDGFTLTWAFGAKLRVVQDRRTVETSALKTGQEIGVAGIKADGATTA